MHRSARLPPDSLPPDAWSDDSATIQLEPKRVLGRLVPASAIDCDKTTRIDLSGLARFVQDGSGSAEVYREAPTRRFGCESADGASSVSDTLPDVETPSDPISGLPTGKEAGPRDLIDSIPAAPAPTSPVAETVPAAPVSRLEKTTIVTRRRRPRSKMSATTVLGGLAIFAWGFATATVLWLYLEGHPGWREDVSAAISSLWTRFVGLGQ